MKAKIIEIFSSIQGEGKYAGTRQVFVRFFECNIHCHWCDTPHSIGDTTRNYREMTLAQVCQEIDKVRAGCQAVTLTGGEPLLQAEFIKALLPQLKERGLSVHVDTNGILPEALSGLIGGIDCVAMDMKLPSSTKCAPYWEEHKEFLKIATRRDVFVKAVITSDTEGIDIEKAAAIVQEIDPGVLFILQPNTFELGNGVVKRCQEFYDICSQRLENVRILPQMHKILKVR